MERVLTGLQPSGNLTIGNYIGSICQMIKYQDIYDSFLFVANMHSITVPQDPKDLPKKIRNLVALYIACGIIPEKNTIYIQSENIYHANASWILECLTPYGELSRMTQFKDKSNKNESFAAGLLTYPVLMAADILLYDADYVPTGQDQKQHVELARNIAKRVNSKYGEIFKLPTPLIPIEGAKIMDLVDPTKKMSKSSENPKGVIYMLDSKEVIRKKIMSATTDSIGKVNYNLENQPGISNLINIYSSLTNESKDSIVEKFNDSNYGSFKTAVADKVVEILIPIQKKYYDLIDSPELDRILDEGLEKTLKIAKKKYENLVEAVGVHR